MPPTSASPANPSNVFPSVEEAHHYSKECNTHPEIGKYLKQKLKSKEQPQPSHEDLVLTNIVFTGAGGAGSISQASCLLSKTTRKSLCQSFEPVIATPSPAVFNIQNIASRSNEVGLFASKNIVPGDIILTERPVVIVPGFLWLNGIVATVDQLFTQVFERIPAEHRETACGMMNIHQDCSMENGIIRTNGLVIKLDHPDDAERIHLGLFTNMGRCNHSCAPNAVWFWDPKSISVILYAVRKLSKNQEITISYTDPSLPATTRQKKLKRSYHFDCDCFQCKSTQASVQNRNVIKEWTKAPIQASLFEAWLQNLETRLKLKQVVDKRRQVHSTLQALTSEKLECLRSVHRELTDLLVRFDGVLGKRGVFKKSLEAAIEVWSIDAGWSSQAKERIEEYKVWLKEPTTFKGFNSCK